MNNRHALLLTPNEGRGIDNIVRASTAYADLPSSGRTRWVVEAPAGFSVLGLVVLSIQLVRWWQPKGPHPAPTGFRIWPVELRESLQASRSQPLHNLKTDAREGQSNAACGDTQQVRQGLEFRLWRNWPTRWRVGLLQFQLQAETRSGYAALKLEIPDVGSNPTRRNSGSTSMTATVPLTSGPQALATRSTSPSRARTRQGRTKVFRGRIAPKDLLVTKEPETSVYTAVSFSTRTPSQEGCVVVPTCPRLPAVSFANFNQEYQYQL